MSVDFGKKCITIDFLFLQESILQNLYADWDLCKDFQMGIFHKFEVSWLKIQAALLAQTRIFDIKRKLDYFSSVDNQTLRIIKDKIKKYIVR